jgi:hypothetical protein
MPQVSAPFCNPSNSLYSSNHDTNYSVPDIEFDLGSSFTPVKAPPETIAYEAGWAPEDSRRQELGPGSPPD